MAENIIQPNIPNAITITIMAAIGTVVAGFLVKLVKGRTGSGIVSGPVNTVP